MYVGNHSYSQPAEGGTVSGGGIFEQGMTCTLTATPAEGYEFINWKENDAIVSTETTYSFTVTNNRNLVANFGLEGLCDIVFNLYDSYGDGWNGNKLIVNANDDANYSFYEELTINNGNSATYTLSILNGSHVTLSWIAGDYIGECSFNVQFASNGYPIYQGTNLNGTSYEFDLNCDDAYTPLTITAVASPAEGGSISGTGDYLMGEVCTLTATPNEGRNFVRWMENGQEVSTEATYSFTVTGSRDLVALFSALASENIVFADSNVEAICVSHWDTDDDGFLSYDEAAVVTDLGRVFRYNSEITSFDELQYFTGLTYFYNNEFERCYNLTSIIIPASVTSIGYEVFEECYNLTSVTIPESVTYIECCVFYSSGLTTLNYNATNCSVDWDWLYGRSLTNLTIGDNVQVIPDHFVSGQSNLVGELVIPESVTTIGSSAFSGCGGLNSVTIGDLVNLIESYAFYNCSGLTSATIGNSVTSIGSYAFGNCSSLALITLPDSVTDIGSSAFYGCSGLTSINIPTSVTHLNYGTFMRCSGLTSITIPETVTYIENHVFGYCDNLATLNFNAINCPWVDAEWMKGCSSLTNVTIGENVQVIPDNFVNNCTGLTSIILPESVISIGNNAFNGCYGLTGNFVIPNNVVSIGDQAFYNCYGFESLVLDNSLETIGSQAFRNCGGLRGELTLPETLQSVGPSAFAGCNEISTVNYNAINCQTMGNASQNVFADCLSLAHIRIGANVQSIPNYAFKPCFLVTDMDVAAEVPPTIYSSTFGTISRSIPVSVPFGSGEAYRTAPYWEEFFHITEDYSPSPYTYHWNFNVHQFGDNMTVTGIIQIDGVEQAVPSLEIGAFCNGECRGRQLLTYYPQVDRYLVFLMIYGEEGDMFSFRLYDHEAGEELTAGCASVITFESDAIVGSFLEPYVFNFTDMQLTQFSEGWNWWSTYVEQEGMDGLSLLEESLGENGVTIRSQVGYTDYYAGYGWYGSLSSINNESSYKIKTSAPCVAAMAGGTAIPSQHPITLNQGWTWMGYLPSFALDINTALDGLEATLGDKVKSQQGYSDYYPGYGWFGSLNTIEPGMGLMYYSANGESVTFAYPDGNRGGELKKNLTAENNHWKPNTHAYPDNMTVMAVVELNGEELNTEDYELAAFAANGECRGSVRLTYAEPINRHVAFLTVSGKDATALSFRLYDTETNEEYYDAEESLDFVANAIVGEATDLYVVHFRGITGMDEFAGRVKVYPNPVNAGERFSIGMEVDIKSSVRVEIVNALGTILSVETSDQLPATIKAPTVAGVYTLRITCEEGTCYCKMVVR